MFRAGKARHRFYLQKSARSDDTWNDPASKGWTNEATIWGWRRDLSGAERFQAQAVNATISGVVGLRYRGNITAERRLLMQMEDTTLAAATTGTTGTSITVSSGSWYGTTEADEGAYRIRVGDEIMIATTGIGTTALTVLRGQDSTTATTHDNGSVVQRLAVLEIDSVLDRTYKRSELEVLIVESA